MWSLALIGMKRVREGNVRFGHDVVAGIKLG
jgi:hypothetical protein